MPRNYHLIVGGGEVEALELVPEKLQKAVAWTGGIEVVSIDPFDSSLRFAALNIPSASGMIRVEQGDYIIKDALGNFSVMKPMEFKQKYEQDS